MNSHINIISSIPVKILMKLKFKYVTALCRHLMLVHVVRSLSPLGEVMGSIRAKGSGMSRITLLIILIINCFLSKKRKEKCVTALCEVILVLGLKSSCAKVCQLIM